ncbi:MAG: glycosyltransferase family 39 protein [Alphaproteobacteria bacterium]|jgi:4-amino-4-deoxy-L-arabinose transferase-like glycosyltransferase|nr:glycosyltransferase family 39 protein [Alphaproteobacteria bacterium]MBT5390160.1 glycosyltransferase family 39 protein [Alphaproteobacteria bacterium]MBT5540002.1 glycosyltransferase family 39 protein [Alphaproteobacteria bacterium]MBT5654183.1 glycosyltransferase family 39 protein [Alphaproteobacteria bacterium]
MEQNKENSHCAYIPKISRFWLFFLVPVLFISFFYQLGAYGLLNNNEGLYGEIAREMLESGSYIIPTLNYVPYIEKPPLLYWLIAISYKIFGVNEFAARLIPALSGAAICGSIFVFARRLKMIDVGGFAAVIMATSLGYIIFSRMVFFDGLLTAFLSLSLLSFYTWYNGGQRLFLLLCYGFLGCAVMVKGFVAPVLFGLVVGGFLLWERAFWSKLRKCLDPIGILIFVAIVLPWHLWASLEEEGFSWFYFINEHVLRFLDLREPKDYYTGPLYYYIPRILGYVFPWTPFLGLLALRTQPSQEVLKKFLWLWFLVPLAFFSLSKAKANYYMIVGIVPMCLLVSMKITELLKDNRWCPILVCGLLSVFLGLVLWGGAYFFPIKGFEIYQPKSPYLLFFVAILSVLGMSLFYIKRQGIFMLFSVAAISGGLFITILGSAQQAEDFFSGKEVGSFLASKDEVYFYKNYEELSSIVFYLKKPVTIVDSVSSDLRYGEEKGDSNRFCDSAQMLKEYENRPREEIYMVVHKKSLHDFQNSFLKTKFNILFSKENIFVLERTDLPKKEL